MRGHRFRSVLLPLILIPAGGLLVLALCYLLYGAIYLSIESLFFAQDPGSVPAGAIRISYAVALLAAYVVLLRTRTPDLLKATVMVGPLATLVIAAILGAYLRPAAAVAATAAIAAGCAFLLYRYRKPWFYAYAAAAALLAGIAYAWPRP